MSPGTAKAGPDKAGPRTHNNAPSVNRDGIPLPVVRGTVYLPSGARTGLLIVVSRCCYCHRAHAHRTLGTRMAGCRTGRYVVIGGAA